jgi:hypothetical protein
MDGLIFLSTLAVLPPPGAVLTGWAVFWWISKAFKRSSQLGMFSAVRKAHPVAEHGCCGGAGIVECCLDQNYLKFTSIERHRQDLVNESPESRDKLNKADSKDTNVSAKNNEVTIGNDDNDKLNHNNNTSLLDALPPGAGH